MSSTFPVWDNFLSACKLFLIFVCVCGWGGGCVPAMSVLSVFIWLQKFFWPSLKKLYWALFTQLHSCFKCTNQWILVCLQSCEVQPLHNFILEHFHCPKRKPHAHLKSFHTPCPPPALGNYQSTLCLYTFDFLDILYKWNNMICVLLHLALLNEHVLGVHQFWSINQYFLWLNILLYGYTTFCLSLTAGRHLNCLLFLAFVYNAAIHSCTSFCVDICFQFSWVYI